MQVVDVLWRITQRVDSRITTRIWSRYGADGALLMCVLLHHALVICRGASIFILGLSLRMLKFFEFRAGFRCLLEREKTWCAGCGCLPLEQNSVGGQEDYCQNIE